MVRRVLHLLGHSHLDVAWLWGTGEGRDALIKTVEHVLNLMRRFKGFKFAQSTALYYLWLKELRPDLLEEVKERVREGRWEVVGGSWVECDCLIPSGESLVRQFLYGLKLIKELLGVRVKVAWFPDSFGFPSSLPMILKGFGIKYFLTQKLNWNDTALIPYNLFRWASPDGSEVIAYQTIGGYWGDPGRTDEVIKQFMLAEVRQGLKEILYLFGYGDHGYGPREGDVVSAEALVKEVPEDLKSIGVAEARHSRAEEFFRFAEGLRSELPRVEGELYLQFHRGTYTSQARIKELIKSCENLLISLEKVLTIKYLITSKPYSREWVEGLWRELLTAQFHDVAAGSVSKTPYREFISRLSKLKSTAEEALNSAVKELVGAGEGRGCLAVFNPLPREVRRPLLLNGRALELRIPSLSISCRSIDELKPINGRVEAYEDGDSIVLDNGLVRVRVDRLSGWVISVEGSSGVGELLGEGGMRFEVFEDEPVLARSTSGTPVRYYDYGFDCWELYHLQRLEGVRFRRLSNPLRIELRVGEGFAECVASYDYVDDSGSALIEHVVRLYGGMEWVEGLIRISWGLKHRLLKLVADLGIWCENVVAGQPYGHVVRRNPASPYSTLYDRAAWESWFNGWLDLSDGLRGLSLICGSRFGYSLMGRWLGLTLLRSPRFPPDMAWNVPWTPELLRRQEFVEGGDYMVKYYLMPHRGSWEDSLTPTVADELINEPLITGCGGCRINSVKSPLRIECGNSMLTAMKLCEGCGDVVLRIFNPYSSWCKASVMLNDDEACLEEVRLDEESTGRVFKGEAMIPPRKLISLKVRLT